MFIKALRAFETATHNVAEGQIADLPEHQATKAIEEGKAIPSSLEESLGIATENVERAVAAPMRNKERRG
jgi:hypothetical protein